MNNTDSLNSDFLFTTPSYLTGAANVFNLAGNFYDYNRSESEQEADCKAIRNDFNIIAEDLKSCLKDFSK